MTTIELLLMDYCTHKDDTTTVSSIFPQLLVRDVFKEAVIRCGPWKGKVVAPNKPRMTTDRKMMEFEVEVTDTKIVILSEKERV